MKLTAIQIDLLKALHGGAKLHYMSFSGRDQAYYFVSGTMKHCTVAAQKLIKCGLVVNTAKNHYDKANFELTEAGRNWKP